jgi:hypothetical protein
MSIRYGVIAFLLGAIVVPVLAGQSTAAVVHVPGDQPTIQAGIDAAAAGDTVLVAAGTYTGAGNHSIDFGGRDLVLLAAEGSANTIIDCEAQARGLWFVNGETAAAIVEGFTVQNGLVDDVGGGVVCLLSSPTFRDCAFIDNSGDSGGAMWLKSSSPEIMGCSFTGNFGGGNSFNAGRGGAIWCGDWSSPTISECTFEDNVGKRGGAVWCSGVSSPTMTDCVFTGNVATSMGGAVMSFGAGSDPMLTDCEFTGNAASSAGGAAVAIESAPTFDGCAFTANLVPIRGGALFGNGAMPFFVDCVFDGNAATEGGALALLDCSPSITNCTFHASDATLGGSIYIWRQSLPSDALIDKTIIAFGVAGEAVVCAGGATAEVSCSDVFGNAGGDWTGCLAGQLGQDGNISEDPLFCDAANGDLRIETGSPCAPPQSGACGLIGGLPAGCETTAITAQPAPPVPVSLRAYPMPFRAGAGLIEWVSEEPASVTLRLYDPLGRLVMSRDLGRRAAGTQQVAWRDVIAGAQLASGVYFVQLDGLASPLEPLRVVWTR